MKKVLFIIGSLQHGGAETVLVDLLNNINQKFDVDLLLINNSGSLASRLDPKVKLRYVTQGLDKCNNIFEKTYNRILQSMIYRFLFKLRLFSKAIYKMLNKNYDVEVAFLAGAPCEIIKNSPNRSSKKIMWIHADVKNDQSKSYFEYLSAYNYFDTIVGVSESSIQTFIKTFPDSANKIKLINNFVDVKRIIRASKEDVKDNIFEKQKINFLSVGRLAEVKGYDRIINIANNYANIIRFNILGAGSKQKDLEDMVKKEKAKNVFLHGIRTNPYPYIKKADAFLLSSRSEAYPTVIIEAMILNKFIVATDVSGVREILNDYDYKIIVENNESGIQKGIEEYLKYKDRIINKDCTNLRFIENNKKNLMKVVELLNEKKA